MANLTLVAPNAGLTGQTRSGPRADSAMIAGIVISASARFGRIWTITLFAAVSLTESLVPTRGFGPDFQATTSRT